MAMLHTLSEILESSESPQASTPQAKQTKNGHSTSTEQTTSAQLKAQREWCGAIAALEALLLSIIDSPSANYDTCQGLVLSSPAPVLSQQALLSRFQTGIFTHVYSHSRPARQFQLPGRRELQQEDADHHKVSEFPLISSDPLAAEQFCLAFTSSFGLVMVWGRDSTGKSKFQFSFEPEVIQRAWKTLRSRLLLTCLEQLERLDALSEQFSRPTPDYRTVMQFSRQLLQNLPEFPSEWEHQRVSTIAEEQGSRGERAPGPEELRSRGEKSQPFTSTPPHLRLSAQNPQYSSRASQSLDVELLQALTHEVRTPLTTIRMLTRVLLKRGDLNADVIKRLEAIDHECTQQINRMELIFRAAELETTTPQQSCVQLTPISLEQVLQQSIPHWKKQAQRRNVNLEVILPEKMPMVVSDPAMLDQVLTGLMEHFTSSLPTGGQIRVQVSTAGNQLKLQLLSQCPSATQQASPFFTNFSQSQLKSIGQLLTLQPETGSLCLNLDVTKNLFQALGGKMTVRHRAEQGEVLTIFLPLGSSLLEVEG
ncbi:MAG: sensor histidine kinase [Cyanobacteria bacterium QS_4_48_99]|nr:MAG: sensor histidine kinase [Cyanobacteria bacterium QS_4_48_99]